jgi:hypothetical protein
LRQSHENDGEYESEHEHDGSRIVLAVLAHLGKRPAMTTDDDDIPDARDGLTRNERIVLWVLSKTQAEENGRNVPLPMLYGRVLEHVDLSIAELQEIVARLGARR